MFQFMKRGLLPLLFICFLLVRVANAQIEPQFTQYMYNQYLFNPAYAGSADAVEFSALYRSQYVGLSNRPISDLGFNFNMPVNAISSGIGLNVVDDVIGYQRSTYASVTYDYRKKFKWGNFSIGANIGLIQASLDGTQLTTPGGTYGNGERNNNDSYVPTTLQNGITPDFSIGTYLNKEDKYFVGVSLDHVIASNAPIETPQKKVTLDFTRDMYFSGGYNFRISPKFMLMPSVIIQTDFTEMQTDIGAMTTIVNNILAGISFRGYDGRSLDALALIFGFRYKGFQAMYSYDATLSYLSKFSSGSHEVSLKYKYELKSKKNQGYYYHNPRFNL
jgi:type IX secretion system PorP/SprF family membrane protein